MKTALLFIVSVAAIAQPVITLTAPPVRVGAPVTVTVTLSGASTSGIAAAEWFLPAIPGMTAVAGPAVTAAGKSIQCAPAVVGPGVGLFGCMAYGGQSTLTDGVLATITFPAPAASVPLVLTNMLGSNAAADSPGIPITSGAPFTLTVLSPCDLNGDRLINLLDVRNLIDQIEGVIPATTHLVSDTNTTVLDLQRVVNAMVDGVCRVGP